MTFARNNAAIARSGIVVVDTVADLRAHPLAAEPSVTFETLGAVVVGDAGNGIWYWDATNADADNGTTVVKPTGLVGTGARKRIVNDITALKNLPSYADDAAAGTGGLVADQLYKTPTGQIMIKL